MKERGWIAVHRVPWTIDGIDDPESIEAELQEEPEESDTEASDLENATANVSIAQPLRPPEFDQKCHGSPKAWHDKRGEQFMTGEKGFKQLYWTKESKTNGYRNQEVKEREPNIAAILEFFNMRLDENNIPVGTKLGPPQRLKDSTTNSTYYRIPFIYTR